MNVLLVGSDNPLGNAIQQRIAQWQRHRLTMLSTAATRWRSERQAKKAARRDKPDAVLDLRLAWKIATGVAPQPEDTERAHWLAKACEHSHMHYILMSSDRVYSGHRKRSIRESDNPDSPDEPGLQMIDVEERVMHAAPSAIVLRTGPLFASEETNLFTSVMQRLEEERNSAFDDHQIFCPVATADVARVLAAMLDQLSAGADAAGIYHYSSGDRTTEYGFAEAALAAGSQYSDFGDVFISPMQQPPESPLESRVLDCSRLRDAFAIKQVPWRGFINTLVKEYVVAASEQSAGAGQ